MSLLRPLLAAFAGAIVAFAISAARADEAYLCADGSVVYVEFGKLAEMKRTNACVAAYYGLKIEKIEPADVTPAPTRTEGDADTTKEPATPRLQTFTSDETPRAARRPLRQSELRAPPSPAPNTDFRRVKVINAVAGEEIWFHHQR